jgi:hypothetical protein
MAGQGFFQDILDGDTFKYYADGEWKVSVSKKSVAITNPSTLKTAFKVQGKLIIFSTLLPPSPNSSFAIQ